MLIMTGVVQWTRSGNKRRCSYNYKFGTPNNTTWTATMQKLTHSAVLLLVLLAVLINPGVNGQRQQSTRRPNVSPALEAYRNRWMAYLKNKAVSSTTPKTVGFRVGNDKVGGGNVGKGNAVVVNGFTCERTYSFFPSQNNPRMYHLCARSRDNWYVYHYACPQGTLYSDGMGKCMHDRREEVNTISENNNTNENKDVNLRTPTNNKRPTKRVPGRGTTRRPGRIAASSVRKTTTRTTTTTTTTTEPTTSTTTTEEPEPFPEPDSDHTGVTDKNIGASSSSEEASTEDDKSVDVVVSFPGLNAMTSSVQQSSDEVDEDQGIHENEASNEINMNAPESANGQSRLVAASATKPASSPMSTKQKQQTPLRRVPLKVLKAAAVASSSDAASTEDDEDELGSSSTAVGDRRPRILKKIKYWRNFLIGDQNL